MIAMNVNGAYNAGVKVTITAAAREDFLRLPRVMQARLLLLFQRLQRWPNVSGVKPLTGRPAGRYRLRTGDYRLQFRVRGAIVTVERIGHRDRFYED